MTPSTPTGLTDEVIRYVPTYIDRRGMRTLMRENQGRATFATAAEAQAWIDAVMENVSTARVRELWGDNPRFEVRPCACWPNHYDPKGIYFDDPADRLTHAVEDWRPCPNSSDRDGEKYQAICGARVPRRLTADEPTCPTCRVELEENARLFQRFQGG